MGKRPKPVEQFLAEARPERRAMIEAIDVLIRDVAPDLPTGREGRFLGYGPFHYRYASGREGDTFAIGMMDGAQALSVYVLGGEDGRYLTESRAHRLGKVSVGKSCIRVKRLEHLDLEAFRDLVATSVEQLRSGTLGNEP
jgi:hypothetical protein